ncbi:MAG: HEAT repeat domain-containing protein [Lentisphaerales bacterium]|nr:HEAT repeat domain-containing protein [Lentisphaerales bacterium]
MRNLFKAITFASLSVSTFLTAETVEDFKQGSFAKWHVEGNAFGKKATRSVGEVIREIKDGSKNLYAHSGHGGVSSTGRMISKEFEIKKKIIEYSIAGGKDKKNLLINLLVDDKVVASATGFNKYDVKTEYFEVSKWKGKKARFELVDRKKGNFGFIAVGNIVQKMKPTFKKRSNVSFNVPAEFDVDLYAGSDLVRNPVSISIDGKGRVYAAEVHRFQKGVEDSRRFNAWFLDEININSLQGRLDLYEKWTAKGLFKEGHFTQHSDKITTLEDTNGDGKADKSTSYADGFNGALTGNAGSILLGQNGEMFYANIPHVWKLTDGDGDGVSEKREKLVSGFGFRNGVNGHDLHGLEWGVDGRIYFSNGDRGFEVKTQEGKILKSSERGAIFRCEPDGSNLEIFTIGNRNPQDLAFDQFGNLFTVDNNRGRGDRSRVCYLVELGDYGWNSGHENKTTFFRATKLHERKGFKPADSWKLEGDWKEEFDGQAAYVIPSIFFIDGGSAGITFNPGESLGDKYTNKFMYSAYQLGIHAFNFIPKGSGLQKKESEKFWGGGLIMDTEFDYDGRFYVADYVASNDYKDGRPKGSIYVLKNDEYLNRQSVKSAAALLKAGFKDISFEQLYKNLFHKDMRVRLQSQFELTNRGKKGSEILASALKQTENEVARLHGIWGIGQFSRKDSAYNSLLETFLTDQNWRVRAQVAKVIGESKDSKYISKLIKLLRDENGRVQFYAATALGKLGNKSEIVSALINAANENGDKDVFMRHSVVAGLIYTEANDDIAEHISSTSAAVRKVVLLALARLGDERVDEFLKDQDLSIVQESIRAIDRMLNDQLTQSVGTTLGKYNKAEINLSQTDMERLLQWSFRNGSLVAAKNTSDLVINNKAPESLRIIALYDLLRWHEKLPMDPVIGQVRFINPNRADVKNIIKNTIKASLEDKSSEELASLIVGLSIEYGLAKNTNALAAKILDKNESVEVRLDILRKLVSSKDASVNEILNHLVKDQNKALKKEALLTLNKLDKMQYNQAIKSLIASGSDLQVLYTVLQETNDVANSKAVQDGLVSLNRGQHEGESLLELLEAAESFNSAGIKNLLTKYRKSQTSGDDLFVYRSTMYGGDAAKGRKLVYEQGVGQCIICHKVEGKGGVVAPDLTDLANLKRSTSKYLVESLVHPSKYVVPGYGNVTVSLKDGNAVIASLISKNDQQVVVKMVTGERAIYPMSKVNSVTDPLSSMPPMGAVLNKRDIRDIVAYLKILKKAEH